MWWILFQKVELKWCWLTITYTTWDNRNNLWLCCSLSSSEDDVEEHAKDSKDNARGGQDGVADEEGLVDFSKHLYWCAIGGDTTLRDFKWQREGGEQEGKEEGERTRKGKERQREDCGILHCIVPKSGHGCLCSKTKNQGRYLCDEGLTMQTSTTPSCTSWSLIVNITHTLSRAE